MTLNSRPRIWHRVVPGLIVLPFLVAVQGCNLLSWQQVQQEVEQIEEPDDLVFEDITLEQANATGARLWKLDATRAIYKDDNSIAYVDAPTGQFFRAGEAVYEVESETGEVHQDGEKIYLRGSVVLRDLQGDATLYGDELDWYPEENVIVINSNLRGRFEEQDVDFVADRGRLEGQGETQKLTLDGDIRAVYQPSRIRLQTDSLLWLISQKRVEGDRPVLIERFDEEDPEKVTDRATGKRIQGDLDKLRITLLADAKVELSDPFIVVSSDELTWDAKQNQVEANKPVMIEDPAQRFRVVAQSGLMKLKEEIVTLKGAVDGRTLSPPSRLQADEVVWNMQNQQVNADGNVFYQRTDPQMTVRGSHATARLDSEVIVVDRGRVTSTFIPD